MRISSRNALFLALALVALISVARIPTTLHNSSSERITKLPDGTVIRNVEAIGPEGDVLITREKSHYAITYAKKYDSFLVIIYGHDFDVSRELAEEKFLEVVGHGSEDNVCQKNVRIVPFIKAHPERANQELPLSFCS